MTTTKQRINISISDTMNEALVRLAKRDNMPTATKAMTLIESALEIEEDYALGQLVETRDTKGVKWVKNTKGLWK